MASVPREANEVVRLPPVDPLQVAPVDDVGAGQPGAGEPPSAAGPPIPAGPLPVDPAGPLSLLEDETPSPKSWEGSLELGLDGASGNNDAFNFRLGLNAKRRVALNAFTIQMDYYKKSSQSVDTANRLFTESRFERSFLDSPWTCFVHGTVEYDEFAAFDTRVASDVGVGRKLIDRDTTFLIGRFGAGVSRQFGGPDNDFTPEAVFGVALEHRLSSRHRMVAAIDYMPDITDFTHYRINSQAAIEFLIDQQLKLSLKLGILDRYDSTPDGKKPNDLDYAAVLLWRF